MNGLSPLVSLATQLHSQPGVFAVLLGSGVSTSAGLPTGWQVVKELVRRAAVARDVASPPPDTDAEVEAWWAEHGSGELGYSTVLESLAPTPAGRQALLEGFFEPTGGEDAAPTAPSVAHCALAKLVADGTVRVILTTNFDRLIEQALQEQGVHAQVISRPEAVAGMKPLAHARATVIKLHGDYKDLTTLNTPQELGSYPVQWQTLLEQVFQEYGLLIAGWSSEWDAALVKEVERSASRRYPLYWDSRSSCGSRAKELLQSRDGTVVETSGADELFTELHESVTALQTMTEPPLTTAIAVARVKRYLLDPVKRIELHDIVTARVEPVRAAIADIGAEPVATVEAYGDHLRRLAEATRPLLELLAVGTRHDNENTHERIWNDILARLLALRGLPGGTFNDSVWHAHHYPALLAFYVMGAASVASDNEQLMVGMGSRHKWENPFGNASTEPAVYALRPDVVLAWDWVNELARWNGTKWQQPPSHLVRDDLADLVSGLTLDGNSARLFDDVEYRHSLLAWKLPQPYQRALTGEYRGDRHSGGAKLIAAGERMRASAARHGTSWPWWPVVGKDLDGGLTEFEAGAGWNGR